MGNCCEFITFEKSEQIKYEKSKTKNEHVQTFNKINFIVAVIKMEAPSLSERKRNEEMKRYYRT